MDLVKFFLNIRRHKKYLLIAFCIGVALGIGIYALPKKYIVEGDFFIGRQIEPSAEFFTYEGYYSQTNAALFADTFVALTESNDIKKELLVKLDMPVNTENIKKIKKYIQTKRPGAHIANITIKSYDKNTAVKIWDNLSEILLSKTQYLTQQSDPNLKISRVADTPLIRRDDHVLIVDALLGGLVSVVLYVSYLFVKSYYTKNL